MEVIYISLYKFYLKIMVVRYFSVYEHYGDHLQLKEMLMLRRYNKGNWLPWDRDRRTMKKIEVMK